MKQLLIISALALAAVSCQDNNDAPVAQQKPFYVNETEHVVGEWISLSLATEGYPIDKRAYQWKLTEPDKGFTANDSSLESWSGLITVLDAQNNVVTVFSTTCKTTKIDIGQAVVGSFCTLETVK